SRTAAPTKTPSILIGWDCSMVDTPKLRSGAGEVVSCGHTDAGHAGAGHAGAGHAGAGHAGAGHAGALARRVAAWSPGQIVRAGPPIRAGGSVRYSPPDFVVGLVPLPSSEGSNARRACVRHASAGRRGNSQSTARSSVMRAGCVPNTMTRLATDNASS